MLSRAEERLVRALGTRRRREAKGLFLAEGVRIAEELLDAGLVLRLTVVSSSLEDTPRGRALADRLRGAGPVRDLPDHRLAELAGTRAPQGVLVVAEIPGAALDLVEPGPGSTALVLDGVQDPGNVGVLARTAAAFGCMLVVCLPGTVDAWNPKAVRASAGALFRMPVLEAAHGELWPWLERHDVLLLGADAAGEPVGAGRPAGPVALAVGNEGSGLGEETKARCRGLVAVPMRGGVESLNVAVAAGILLYELSRERA
jgi:RNA methyltransferase, TrmH family